MMFVEELTREGHTRRFSINRLRDKGWEVCDEHDGRVIRRICYTDWHRVERALGRFTLEIDDLARRGWSRLHQP